ncbi:hypothetical protein RRG08_046649 [Elysia crispata]|uniref:MD-2-related lipid-recognition domain-containing protein n=1 Tax=Elysia crispata TaxID=231223 RepID=A0AAE1ARC9_9GAST|nr:hypothetical protein RRG08_046649 [Elysia crispata]
MNSSIILAVFCLIAATAVAKKIPIKDCGSKKATIDSIDISPCTSIPCPFKKGTSVNVTIDFMSKTTFDSAKSSVHGIIAGIPVPFPMKDSNACHFMECPVKKGEKRSYTNSVEVLKVYPEITVLVKWEIVSDGDVICFTVPVKIVS